MIGRLSGGPKSLPGFLDGLDGLVRGKLGTQQVGADAFHLDNRAPIAQDGKGIHLGDPDDPGPAFLGGVAVFLPVVDPKLDVARAGLESRAVCLAMPLQSHDYITLGG